MARGLPECSFEQVSVQPGLIARLQYAASRTAGMEERCPPRDQRVSARRRAARVVTGTDAKRPREWAARFPDPRLLPTSGLDDGNGAGFQSAPARS